MNVATTAACASEPEGLRTGGGNFTFDQLWRVLTDTYRANQRRIALAYGDNIIARVERAYTHNHTSVSSVLLSNSGSMTEEFLGATLRKRVFVAKFTLKRDPGAAGRATNNAWTRECRLFDWTGLAGPQQIAAASTASVVSGPRGHEGGVAIPLTGPVVAGNPQTVASSTSGHAASESCGGGGGGGGGYTGTSFIRQANAIADLFATTDASCVLDTGSSNVQNPHDDYDDDDDDGDDDDDDSEPVDLAEEWERESAAADEEEEFDHVGSSDNNGRQRPARGAGGNRLSQKGKSFTAKGIRRQHWAQQSYRNFFHQFLFAVRGMRVSEQLNFHLEDSRF